MSGGLPRMLRRAVARAATKVAERAGGAKLLALDYPPQHVVPRYGYGRPPHQRLHRLLAEHEDRYRRNLEVLLGYREDLLRISRRPAAPAEPWWLSAWLPGMDAVAIYGFLRSRAPRTYLEIGSGMSTMWARRAISDGRLPTRLVSIDPVPRAEVDALCDVTVREPLETTDLGLIGELRSGDVLFMDGSHRVFTNSDATVFFLDVLPNLPEGVLVGVHDILLPYDYLPMWTQWYWSEQYLMGAYLLAEGDKARPELASSYVSSDGELARVLAPLWEAPQLADVDRRGFALWLTTTNR